MPKKKPKDEKITKKKIPQIRLLVNFRVKMGS
jgi:hypothetical protein